MKKVWRWSFNGTNGWKQYGEPHQWMIYPWNGALWGLLNWLQVLFIYKSTDKAGVIWTLLSAGCIALRASLSAESWVRREITRFNVMLCNTGLFAGTVTTSSKQKTHTGDNATQKCDSRTKFQHVEKYSFNLETLWTQQKSNYGGL